MNNLRYWRQERLLSQQELAEASGIPRYAIQLHEQGIKGLNYAALTVIAETLGLDASLFMQEGFKDGSSTRD